MANYEDGFERPEWWDRHLKSQTCNSPSTASPEPTCDPGEKPPGELADTLLTPETMVQLGLPTDYGCIVLTSPPRPPFPMGAWSNE